MRSDAPPLLPIFRSRLQADLLALLLLHPDSEFTLADLSRRLGIPQSSLQHETKRLETAGILVARPIGRARLIRANADHPIVRPLTDLLMVTIGPRTVIADEFSQVEGIRNVMIYGSWAARYEGEPGPPPNDVDVLVLGRPDRSEVYEAADRCQQRLRLPVNPVIRRSERWSMPGDRLIADIRASHFVTVIGELPGTEG